MSDVIQYVLYFQAILLPFIARDLSQSLLSVSILPWPLIRIQVITLYFASDYLFRSIDTFLVLTCLDFSSLPHLASQAISYRIEF
jgi:hypothetical protein